MGMDVGGSVNVMVGDCENSLPTTIILFNEIGKKRHLLEVKKEDRDVRN